eukprot:2071719-Pyramimonas_sp.AAC.1
MAGHAPPCAAGAPAGGTAGAAVTACDVAAVRLRTGRDGTRDATDHSFLAGRGGGRMSASREDNNMR